MKQDQTDEYKPFMLQSLQLFKDLQSVLKDKYTRWLNLSVLFFVAALPFHLWGFTLPFFGFYINYTEIAFGLIMVVGAYAFIKGRIKIRNAYWLYFFLALHAGVQFFSMFAAPYGVDDTGPAIAAAQYSIVLFVLINAIRTEKLLKVILQIMGFSILLVVVHSLWIFIQQEGVFFTRTQPSIIGSGIAHYLAYLLLVFGVGIVFSFFHETERRIRYAVLVAIAAWMYVTVLTGVKAAQIATLIFLAILFIVLKGKRMQTVALIALFIAIFFIQYQFIPIRNGFRQVSKVASEKALAFEDGVIDGVKRFGDFAVDIITGEYLPKRRAIKVAALVQEQEKYDDAVKRAPFASPIVTTPSDLVVPSPEFIPPSLPSPPPALAPSPPAPVEAKPERLTLTLKEARGLFKTESILADSQEPVAVSAKLPPPRPAPELEKPSRFAAFISRLKGTGELSEQNSVRLRWVGGNSSDSIILRVRGIITGWYMGLRYPLTGVGPGQQRYFFNHFSEMVREKTLDPAYRSLWPKAVSQYFSYDKWPITRTNPQNFFIMVWAETGVFGLIALLGVVGVIVIKPIIVLWTTRSSKMISVLRFLFASFVGIMFFQQVNFAFLHPWVWTIFALLYVAASDINDPDAIKLKTP